MTNEEELEEETVRVVDLFTVCVDETGGIYIRWPAYSFDDADEVELVGVSGNDKISELLRLRNIDAITNRKH